MSRFDPTAFISSRRDERNLGHLTFRPYAKNLRTFARFTKVHWLTDRLSPGADEAAQTSPISVALLIIKLLNLTGLRISELTNVKGRSLSPNCGQILARGKGSKKRIVFVPNRELEEKFQRYFQIRQSTAPLQPCCSSTQRGVRSARQLSAKGSGLRQNASASNST
ncbi:MAG: hypothetical protein AAF714_00055 [Pseudomonadota bacterium]